MVMALGLGDLRCGADRTPVEVHQSPIRHGVRKDHAAAAPVACGMRPGAWRRIAHAQLLRQFEGNAALLQVRFAAAAWQSRLEGRELLSQVRASWSRRTRC